MRHLPSIGAIPAPGTADLFMVIKQDTRGTCFVISDTPMDWLLQHCHSHARPPDHDIGAWEHTTHSSLRREPRHPDRIRHHVRQQQTSPLSNHYPRRSPGPAAEATSSQVSDTDR